MGSQSARGPDVSEPMSPCGTCGPFAVSTLLDIAEKDAETRCVNTHARLTTEHEERLRCSEYLGTPADGMCHHTVVHDVLRCSATSMSLVKPSDYATIHDGQAFAVYGKLNMAFRPFTLNKAGGLDRWTDEDCTRNTFFGMLPIDGEDNNDYHVIIINLSRLHCRHYSGRGPSVGLDILWFEWHAIVFSDSTLSEAHRSGSTFCGLSDTRLFLVTVLWPRPIAAVKISAGWGINYSTDYYLSISVLPLCVQSFEDLPPAEFRAARPPSAPYLRGNRSVRISLVGIAAADAGNCRTPHPSF